MTNKLKANILKGISLIISVGAPFAATLFQFPIWVERSAPATMSGMFIVLAFLSTLPFLKQIREWLKSPSIPIVWAILFAFFLALRNIIEDMIVVCAVGLFSAIVGAVLWKIGSYILTKEEDTDDRQDPA